MKSPRCSRSLWRDEGPLARHETTGFVLVAVMVSLVIIALLITGAFFASGQALNVSRNQVQDQQALGFAEHTMARAIADWDSVARGAMTQGQTVALEFARSPAFAGKAFVTRLDTALYFIVAESRTPAGGGSGLRRRVGVVVSTVRNGTPVNPPIRVAEQSWSELY